MAPRTPPRFFTEELKPYFAYTGHGGGWCKWCDGYVRGRGFMKTVMPVNSIDGEKAFELYFSCNEKGHLQFCGYTRPVDHAKNNGGNSDPYAVKRIEEDFEAAPERRAKVLRDTGYDITKPPTPPLATAQE